MRGIGFPRMHVAEDRPTFAAIHAGDGGLIS
jgi:hypothetical protein